MIPFLLGGGAESGGIPSEERAERDRVRAGAVVQADRGRRLLRVAAPTALLLPVAGLLAVALVVSLLTVAGLAVAGLALLVAALLGAVPLAFGRGTGSELRHPLGITMVGGLIVSQMLTLFTTPVIYLAFDRLARRVSGKDRAPEAAAVPRLRLPRPSPCSS